MHSSFKSAVLQIVRPLQTGEQLPGARDTERSAATSSAKGFVTKTPISTLSGGAGAGAACWHHGEREQQHRSDRAW